MEIINGDQLVSILESRKKKIGILDNNSISFMCKIRFSSKIEQVIRKYDIILIPKWVYYEIGDSEERVLYLNSLENEKVRIYIVDEMEYEQISKYKTIWLYKFFLYSCFKIGKLKSFLKRNVEKNSKLEDLEDYDIWINAFYDNAFEGTKLKNGRVQRKNAGEISICVLSLIISYIYNNEHSITIISSDRDAYDFLQESRELIKKDRDLNNKQSICITFKSNDAIIKEINNRRLLLENKSIEEIIKFRDERRVKYTINSDDGSVEEYDKVVKDNDFRKLLDEMTFNIIF